jgi:tRNA nucleotidyltransferase (CCA-adding enzyme)
LLECHTPGELLICWQASGKLALWLPEVDGLFGVPQRPEHHPEVDTGIHVAMCLEMAHRLDASLPARFAVLMHDLGKALTPTCELPKHIDHERRGLAPVTAVCLRFAVPAYWHKLALLVCEYHLHAHRALEMRPKSIVRMLSETGLETDPTLLEDFILACEADKRGRLGRTEHDYPQGRYVRLAAKALQDLPTAPGELLPDRARQERHRARIEAVSDCARPFRQATADARAPSQDC